MTLLKATHGRIICDPSPPKEFQALPFTRPFFFRWEHKPAAHLNLTPCQQHIKHLSEHQQVWVGSYPLYTFCIKDAQTLCPFYIHWQHPAPSWSAVGVVPREGDGAWTGPTCSKERALLSLCHCAQHRLVQLHFWVNFSLAKWWLGKGFFLPHCGKCFAITLNMTQIFPCSQDNFNDKGFFNIANLWHLFYTTYNCQIFMRLTSEYKHTLAVQRCD